jgi:hypothetical protein
MHIQSTGAIIIFTMSSLEAIYKALRHSPRKHKSSYSMEEDVSVDAFVVDGDDKKETQQQQWIYVGSVVVSAVVRSKVIQNHC